VRRPQLATPRQAFTVGDGELEGAAGNHLGPILARSSSTPNLQFPTPRVGSLGVEAQVNSSALLVSFCT
jgi:hypothetical protein